MHFYPSLSPSLTCACSALCLCIRALLLTTANQHLNQQAHAAAAGEAPQADVTPHCAVAAAAAGRSSGGADVSSGGVGGAGGNSTPSKSRRTAPSVNSGSTGPPVGTKRGHEDGSDEGAPAGKKVRQHGVLSASLCSAFCPSSYACALCQLRFCLLLLARVHGVTSPHQQQACSSLQQSTSSRRVWGR
jgi:hypothetical protein